MLFTLFDTALTVVSMSVCDVYSPDIEARSYELADGEANIVMAETHKDDRSS